VGIAALLACAALAWPASGSAVMNTITIGATTPDAANCFPFGGFLADGGWGPYFAFVYKDIPPFHLRPGDIVAYDLNVPNDTDNRMDVAMAATTANGNDVNSGPFTTVATNAQTPANPRGDDITSNYELQWTASAAFDFTGGGLLVRFSNPAGPFATDASCDGRMAGANLASDASGFFVERTYGDTDGVSPWGITDAGDIAQFRLILNQPSNSFKVRKAKRNKKRGTAQLPVEVPGPGTLTLAGSGLKAKTASGTGARTSVDAAGTVNLTVKPKKKLKGKLLRRHKARVTAKVTFSPAAPSDHPAGVPNTQTVKLKLIQR
jgi:hypothetical protein